MKEDHKYLLNALLISTVLRLIALFNYYVNPIYAFSNGIPYYLKYDSWYYTNVLESLGLSKLLVFFLPYVFILFSIYFIYKSLRLLKVNPEYSIYSTLIISFFPNFFFQSLIGYVDTNCLIFFSTTGLIYLLIRVFTQNISKLQFLLFYLLFIIPLNYWKGIYFISGIFIISILSFLLISNSRINKKLLLFMGSVISLILIPYFYKILLHILDYKNKGVGEYTTNTFLGFYLLLFIILYLIFKFRIRRKIEIFFITSIIITSISTIFIQRFVSIAIIFIGIYLGDLVYNYSKFNSRDAKFIMLTLILIFGFFSFKIAPSNSITVNDEIVETLLEVDGEIINFWEYGHITCYFVGNCYTKASPSNDAINYLRYLMIDESKGTKELDKIKEGKYYIFFDDNNDNHYDWLLKNENYDIIIKDTSNNSIFYKTINNKTTDNFKFISSANLGDRRFYLLQRTR